MNLDTRSKAKPPEGANALLFWQPGVLSYSNSETQKDPEGSGQQP